MKCGCNSITINEMHNAILTKVIVSPWLGSNLQCISQHSSESAH